MRIAQHVPVVCILWGECCPAGDAVHPCPVCGAAVGRGLLCVWLPVLCSCVGMAACKDTRGYLAVK